MCVWEKASKQSKKRNRMKSAVVWDIYGSDVEMKKEDPDSSEHLSSHVATRFEFLSLAQLVEPHTKQKKRDVGTFRGVLNVNLENLQSLLAPTSLVLVINVKSSHESVKQPLCRGY